MEDCLIILGLLKQVVYRQNISADTKVDHPGREMQQFKQVLPSEQPCVDQSVT